MTDYLCDDCKNCKGTRLYHYLDSAGIERSVTNAVKVKCGASGCRPYVVKDAKRRVDYAEPWQTCWDYKPRKGAR